MTRLIAFYLPQFHPIPENDRWWGAGFTEWTNVRGARPLFRGHYQPHEPGEGGYYDLRDAAARAAQAGLASSHGIEGFCYWHYWFSGRRLLQRPFDEVLASGQPELPFCLAWANEPWSRRWTGEERDILQAQAYSPEDDLAHVRWLIQAFTDHRYIRIDGRPLFCVYRPHDLPDPRRTTELWRRECVRAGVGEPLLVGIDAQCPGTDCRNLGFDRTLGFEPQLDALPHYAHDRPSLAKLRRNLRHGVISPRLKIYGDAEARELMRRYREPADSERPAVRCVFVGWDNSPRRGRDGVIVSGGTPERFEAALEEAAGAVADRPPQERLVFINAWNEWAEGNHLEPDRRHGRAMLEAVGRVAGADASG